MVQVQASVEMQPVQARVVDVLVGWWVH